MDHHDSKFRSFIDRTLEPGPIRARRKRKPLDVRHLDDMAIEVLRLIDDKENDGLSALESGASAEHEETSAQGIRRIYSAQSLDELSNADLLWMLALELSTRDLTLEIPGNLVAHLRFRAENQGWSGQKGK